MHYFINYDSARSIQQSRLEDAERQRVSRRARLRRRSSDAMPAVAPPTLVPLPDGGASAEPRLDADEERLQASA